MVKGLKVSVIIPIYKGERTLDKCLNSLENQTISRDAYEILTVVDKGGYNKKIKEILSFHKVKSVVSSKRLYFGGIRNLGIKNSKGGIIAFIDQDCYACKDWIERILMNFRKYKVGLVYGKRKSLWEKIHFKRFKELKYMLKSGKFEEKRKRIFDKDNWKVAYISSGQNMAFKKEIFDKYGFFDEGYKMYGSEDIIFQFRLLSRNVKILFDPKMFVIHDHSLNFLEWLKKSYTYGVGNCIVAEKNKRLLENKWIRAYYLRLYPTFTPYKKIFFKLNFKPTLIDLIEIFLMESTDYICKMLARFKKTK